MTNKQLLIGAAIIVAGVGVYIYWQKHKRTVVNPQPTVTPVVPPTTTTQPTNNSTYGDYVDAGVNAWDSLSKLWS